MAKKNRQPRQDMPGAGTLHALEFLQQEKGRQDERTRAEASRMFDGIIADRDALYNSLVTDKPAGDKELDGISALERKIQEFEVLLKEKRGIFHTRDLDEMEGTLTETKKWLEETTELAVSGKALVPSAEALERQSNLRKALYGPYIDPKDWWKNDDAGNPITEERRFALVDSYLAGKISQEELAGSIKKGSRKKYFADLDKYKGQTAAETPKPIEAAEEPGVDIYHPDFWKPNFGSSGIDAEIKRVREGKGKKKRLLQLLNPRHADEFFAELEKKMKKDGISFLPDEAVSKPATEAPSAPPAVETKEKKQVWTRSGIEGRITNIYSDLKNPGYYLPPTEKTHDTPQAYTEAQVMKLFTGDIPREEFSKLLDLNDQGKKDFFAAVDEVIALNQELEKLPAAKPIEAPKAAEKRSEEPKPEARKESAVEREIRKDIKKLQTQIQDLEDGDLVQNWQQSDFAAYLTKLRVEIDGLEVEIDGEKGQLLDAEATLKTLFALSDKLQLLETEYRILVAEQIHKQSEKKTTSKAKPTPEPTPPPTPEPRLEPALVAAPFVVPDNFPWKEEGKDEGTDELPNEDERTEEMVRNREDEATEEITQDLSGLERQAMILGAMADDGMNYHPTLEFDIQRLTNEFSGVKAKAQVELARDPDVIHMSPKQEREMREKLAAAEAAVIALKKKREKEEERTAPFVASEKRLSMAEAIEIDRAYEAELDRVLEVLHEVDGLLRKRPRDVERITRELSFVSARSEAAFEEHREKTGSRRLLEHLLEKREEVEKKLEQYKKRLKVPLPPMTPEEKERAMELPHDTLYREQMHFLLGKMKAAEILLGQPERDVEKIKRQLAGIANAAAAAWATHQKDAGTEPMLAHLQQQTDMLKRSLDLASERVKIMRPVEVAVEWVEDESETPKPAPKRKRRAKVVPADLLQPGETQKSEQPDLTQITSPKTPEKKEPGLRERLSRGLSYLWSRGQAAPEELYAYHVKGEKTPEELGEREYSTFGIGVSVAASVLRTASSFAGVTVFADLPRFLSQSRFTKQEREALTASITAAAESEKKIAAGGKQYEELKERHSRMAERIQASRYLTPKDKERLLEKITDVVTRSTEYRLNNAEKLNQALAEIVNEFVQNQVTLGQLTRETTNTTLAVTGEHLLRAPTYGGFALVESYEQISKQMNFGASATDKVLKLVGEGYEKYLHDIALQSGETKQERAYNALLALGKTIRAGVMVGASLELWETLPTIETITAQDVSRRIDDALQALRAVDANHVLKELGEHGMSIFDAEAAEGTAEGQLAKEMIEAAERTALSTAELAQAYAEGTVRPADGIAKVLTRVIEQHPEKYGFTGSDDELAVDIFARRLAKEMVQGEGLLRSELTGESVGNLTIIPVERAGAWHVQFLDAQTHQELSPEEVKEYITTKPRR